MKNSITKSINLKVLLALLVITLSITAGQNNKLSELTKNKFALQNISSCIKSENEQVRKSSIYFAGLYKLIETEEKLIEQLKSEQCPENRVLIGLALYRMNSEKGMKELRNIAKTDKDERVKKMSYSIYKEYSDKKAS